MRTDFSYLFTPFLAWLVAGTLKLVINSVRARKLAFGLIGYGGLPSNHTAIVTSVAALVALKQGFDHPAFGVALALAFIEVLDATSLRREVGKHAALLNKLDNPSTGTTPLRERMGHSCIEVGAGIFVGISVAVIITTLINSKV